MAWSDDILEAFAAAISAAKKYTDEETEQMRTKFVKVNALPAQGDSQTIYLVPKTEDMFDKKFKDFFGKYCDKTASKPSIMSYWGQNPTSNCLFAQQGNDKYVLVSSTISVTDTSISSSDGNWYMQWSDVSGSDPAAIAFGQAYTGGFSIYNQYGVDYEAYTYDQLVDPYNTYDEYIWTSQNTYEKIGDTEIDLSDYATKEEFQALLDKFNNQIGDHTVNTNVPKYNASFKNNTYSIVLPTETQAYSDLADGEIGFRRDECPIPNDLMPSSSDPAVVSKTKVKGWDTIASANTLGKVKVGTGLSINPSTGALSLDQNAIGPEVAEYCSEHFSEWSGALDDTLESNVMAAPADKVGELNSALSKLDPPYNVPIKWEQGYIDGTTGADASSSGAIRTGKIYTENVESVAFSLTKNANVAGMTIFYYGANDTYLYRISFTTDGNYKIKNDAYSYVRLTLYNWNNPVTVSDATCITNCVAHPKECKVAEEAKSLNNSTAFGKYAINTNWLNGYIDNSNVFHEHRSYVTSDYIDIRDYANFEIDNNTIPVGTNLMLVVAFDASKTYIKKVNFTSLQSNNIGLSLKTEYKTAFVRIICQQGSADIINPSAYNSILSIYGVLKNNADEMAEGFYTNKQTLSTLKAEGAIPSTHIKMDLSNLSNSDYLIFAGRNLLDNKNIADYNDNGIVITNNHDGTFTANGTATADCTYQVCATNFRLGAGIGRMTFSGVPSGGSTSTYYLSLSGYGNTASKNAKTVEIHSAFQTHADIVIKSGVTVSDLVFKPMVEIGGILHEFEQGYYCENTVSNAKTYDYCVLSKNFSLYSLSGNAFDVSYAKGNDKESLPSYYDSYLATKVTTLKGLDDVIGSNGDRFAFITDFHMFNLNACHSPKILKYLQSKLYLGMTVFGGDGINSTDYETEMKDAYIEFFNLFSGVDNFYPIIGNHEFYSDWAQAGTYKGGITASEVYSYFNKGMEKIVTDGDGLAGYYIDNKVQKIRYYFIGCDYYADVPDITASWFISSLENLPSGYLVIVMAHFACTKNNVSVSFLDKGIHAALVALNSGNESYCPIVISGHMHEDSAIVVDGLNYVGVTTDNYSIEEGGITRTYGTVNEQAFDIVSIDKTNRKIYLTRIGGGSDREISY